MPRSVAMAVILAGTAASAPAQTRSSDSAGFFPRGTLTLQTYAAFGDDFGGETFGRGTVGLGYYVFDNLAINAEVSGYFIGQEAETDAGAIGGVLMLRHHWFHLPKGSIFGEFGMGLFEASARVPAGGTRFNFTTEAGVGAMHELSDRTFLLGGVRYIHLSNAKINGPDRNPAINGVEFWLGMMWRF